MSAVLQRPSIRFLPPQLADQIAAGEVIERPASVLKELLENALDARASRIDIELSIGGMERIRVTDNGEGIPCAELPLAVSRHATSKLFSLQDLLALSTLGFRGEALASICSVSQWQLISCSDDVTPACQLSSAQPSQATSTQHARGTTVQIDRLFHNTPARKKFLRAERTEFRHCDEIIRRMALARFDVAFYVKHNGRQVHRLPAILDEAARNRRVAQVCGEHFVQGSLLIAYPHTDMRLWGWISRPEHSRQQADLQYFYINGRMVRDRMLNHAIRLAYQQLLPSGRQAAYVLYLEMAPDSFDVNVHPTKQEVRFRETRLVHDFILRSLRDALTNATNPTKLAVDTDNAWVSEPAVSYVPGQASQVEHVQRTHPPMMSAGQNTSAILFERFIITRLENKTLLVDLPATYARWAAGNWYRQYCTAKVSRQPLLIPERISLDNTSCDRIEKYAQSFLSLGLDISRLSHHEVLLRFMPGWLAAYNHQQLITNILQSHLPNLDKTDLHQVLVSCPLDLARIDLPILLKAIAATPEDFADSWRVLEAADLAHFFS